MASTELWPIVERRSAAGDGVTDVTPKNRRSDPDRMVLRRYGSVLRRHVESREER